MQLPSPGDQGPAHGEQPASSERPSSEQSNSRISEQPANGSKELPTSRRESESCSVMSIHTATEPTMESTTAVEVAASINEERIRRILRENASLCEELAEVGRELDQSSAMQEDLSAAWKASGLVTSKQKVMAQSLARTAQQASQMETHRLMEAMQQMRELQGVHSQLQAVHRQLELAVQLQSHVLTDCDNRLTARSHHIRKMELALYRIVAQAQKEPGLEAFVVGLIAKSSPGVREVLQCEAQRLALELGMEED